MNKIQIKETIEEWDIHDLNGNLEDVIERLQKLRNDKYENITLKVDIYEDDGAYGNLYINGHRLETDDELNARMELSARLELKKYLAEQKKQEDRKTLFYQLKEEFKDLI